MFEEFIINNIPLVGADYRIAIALLGTIIAAYFDIFKNKNIPDLFVYGFLIIAFLTNFVFFNQMLFKYGVLVGGVLFIIFYILYKFGFVGEADGYILTSIALLIPIYPKIPFNFPFVLSTIINATLLLAIGFILFLIKIIIKKKTLGDYKYWVVFLLYIPFLYFLYTTNMFSLIYLSVILILGLSSVGYMVYKKEIIDEMAVELGIDDINDEEIVALEKMDKKGIPRVINKEIAKELKNKGVKTIYIYAHLPPFIPFILLGMIICLTFGDILMKSMI